MIFLVWSTVVIIALVLYFRKTYSRFSSYGVKHFKIIPFLGNMKNVVLRRNHIGEEVDEMYTHFPSERFIGRYEFIKPTVIVKDLELLKNITIKDFEHFLDHRGFVDDKVEPLFARNLFSLTGQEWKDMRTTLTPAFTSAKIKQMVPFMEEVGEQMIRALKNEIKESDNGSIEIDVKDLTSRYTNDVIATCAFGLKVDSHADRENQFYVVGKTAASFKFRQNLLFFLGTAFPTIVKKFKIQLFAAHVKTFFVDLVMNTMKDRETRRVTRPDMIQILMDVKKGQLKHRENNGDTQRDTGFPTVEDTTSGKRSVNRVWSDHDLIAQAVVFFIAGFETISTATSFTLHELALNPDVQERLVKEIKEHHTRTGGKIDFDSIQSLPYLDMVVSESLRYWPPLLALDRVCVKDYNMGKPNPQAPKDYIIRKGDTVTIPVWSFHRDPEIFPNPDKFDPERFSPENRHMINQLAYMPFGIGPRNCIGSRFALCECKILLYQILLNMEIVPSNKTCIPSKLSYNSFNPRLQGGHWLQFKIRS